MRPNRLFPALFACTVLAATGCASSGGDTGQAAAGEGGESAATEIKDGRAHRTAKSPDGRLEGDIWGTPADGSPFLQLEIGMSRQEAEALVGAGSGERVYLTGKAFIPFYFGTDRIRDEVLYKGVGSLTYAGGGMVSNGGKLVVIVHDPDEGNRRHD